VEMTQFTLDLCSLFVPQRMRASRSIASKPLKRHKKQKT
jgi:hypothetical protein